MNEYLNVLRTCALFDNISDEEIIKMLKCLCAVKRFLGKNESALLQGEPTQKAGILLSGELEGISRGYNGQESLVAGFRPGQVFGEILACSQRTPSPVTITAKTPCTILYFEFSALTNPCAMACPGHITLIRNTMSVIGVQYFNLFKKLSYITTGSIRARVSAYLLDNCKQSGKAFKLPLDREAMAHYLCADRSALSRELSRMKRDGLIDYKKNVFTIADEHKLKGQILGAG